MDTRIKEKEAMGGGMVAPKYVLELLDTMLFICLDQAIALECGDGWAFVVSRRWRELADRYARMSPNRTREDGNNFIMFSNDQEGITFLPSIEHFDPDDILVRWV